MSERAKRDGTQDEAERRVRILEEKFSQLSGSSDPGDLLEATLNAFDNTIVVTDPAEEGNPIIYVNKGFEKLTGYSFEEVVGQNCRFLQKGDRDQAGVQQLREDIRAGRSSSVQLRNYRKDGSLFWNQLYITPVNDREGNLLLFLGVQNDITELKQANEERERLQMAVENADESLLITTTDLDAPGPEIVYVNPAFTRLTGYATEEVIGKDPRFLQGPNTDRSVLKRLRRTLEKGQTFRGETVNYRKDGSEFINAWHIAPVDSGGEITYWIATQRDVTERRALEREVLEAGAREQQRIARDLHDSVGQQFATTIYHLRRLQQDAPESLMDGLEQAVDMVKDLSAQTRDLSHSLHGSSLAGSGLMLGLTKLARQIQETSGIACSFTFEVPVKLRQERAEHLYHIVQEACSNALQHAQASTLKISLTGSGEERILSVYDDGVGFSETDSEADGAGIGLQTMRSRAELVGAELSVEALPSEGSVVRCTFPVARASVAAD